MSKENVSIWLILNVHYRQHYSTVNHQGRSPQLKQQIKINNGVELLNAKKARQIKKMQLVSLPGPTNNWYNRDEEKCLILNAWLLHCASSTSASDSQVHFPNTQKEKEIWRASFWTVADFKDTSSIIWTTTHMLTVHQSVVIPLQSKIWCETLATEQLWGFTMSTPGIWGFAFMTWNKTSRAGLTLGMQGLPTWGQNGSRLISWMIPNHINRSVNVHLWFRVPNHSSFPALLLN